MKKGIKLIIFSILLTIISFVLGSINFTFPKALCIGKEEVQTPGQNGNAKPYYLYTFSFDRGNNQEKGVAYCYSYKDYTIGSYEEYSKVYLTEDDYYEIVLESNRSYKMAMTIVLGITSFIAEVFFVMGLFMVIIEGLKMKVQKPFEDVQRSNFFYVMKDNKLNNINTTNVNEAENNEVIINDSGIIEDNQEFEDDNPIK